MEKTETIVAIGTDGERRRKLKSLVLEKVEEVSSAISAAKHADEVIVALHSLAVLLFPIDASVISGCLDKRYISQLRDAKAPCDAERDEWWHAFYDGLAFPTVSRILLHDVASNWLPCFPFSARKLVYDSFFLKGPAAESVQALVPVLMQNETKDVDHNAVSSNIERLLILCLLENKGICNMVREFGLQLNSDETALGFTEPRNLTFISMIAQMIASIPDRARLEASSALSSHMFFRQVIRQLLDAAEERSTNLSMTMDMHKTTTDAAFLFTGETFSRICRRGSADILVFELMPKLLNHVRSCLAVSCDITALDMIKSKPESIFWSKMMETIKDQYSVERLSEGLLRQLSKNNVSDLEAYWTLWLLFHRAFEHQTGIRALFVDKFLFWKVFPICCLRWILQFSIFECPPYAGAPMESPKNKGFLDTVQRLVSTWSRRGFTQSATMEQQAYITAATGLCLERMSKGELESTKDVLHSVLQGVSCRLESPIHLVRKMASSIALVFSKVVDPENPLYLDDDCHEPVDWDFSLISLRSEIVTTYNANGTKHNESKSSHSRGKKHASNGKGEDVEDESKDAKFSSFRLIDPDEIVDPAIVSSENLYEGEDDNASENSDASSDSLQPYDLSDDDSDLQHKISQIGEISAALRKSDDADGVERALNVAERLVRASPDELRHNAGDLVGALVNVRCSDVAVEGEEDSSEGKRQKALVALLVTCPFESLDALAKLLYSPNVDVSQRILIIDVMTEAALELADTKTLITECQHRNLISSASESQPWFIPSNRGPPGAGPWREVLEAGTLPKLSYRYERELPPKPGHIKMGKSRRWSLGPAKDRQQEWSKNKFPLYAAAFMLPAMQGFDKVRHGVDLLNRDFIVLGKLIHMLGVCMRCIALHPEASALAPTLLDMLRSRGISHHAEAYVRRSALFAASCILSALHPSFVASTLIEGNEQVSSGLEWIRTWALHVAESDPDTECSSMAMTCLRLHAEMALQTSRSLESADSFRSTAGTLSSKMDKIIIPKSNMTYRI